MKILMTVLLTVIVLLAQQPPQASAGAPYWGGSSFHGSAGHSHFAAGVGPGQSGWSHNFGGHRPYTNYGSPAFRSPSLGHFYHFSRRGVPYFSSGFSHRSFGSTSYFGPAGPPPLGAPGPTPFALANPAVARFPFFCRLHGFGYTDQSAFFGHLNFAHHIPLARAGSYCRQVDGGLIFLGF